MAHVDDDFEQKKLKNYFYNKIERLEQNNPNLKELSKSPIEQWLESFTREHMNESIECIELLGTEIYELFKSWCNDNGIKYDINSLKLGVRLTNMNINGISKGSHTKNGATKIFNISELKKTLKIGCIIDV